MMSSIITRSTAFSFAAGIGLLCVAMLTVPSADAQTAISNDGVVYSDGTVQTTAGYSIRDTGPGGGLVFYVTDGGAHGLEAAPADQGAGFVEWGCVGSQIAGADGVYAGSGEQNTADILSACGEAGIAAKLADDYELGDFVDWFLPSKQELDLMYEELHLFGVGGFFLDFYWSSSEVSPNLALAQVFSDGTLLNAGKNGGGRVRAVRAF